MGETRLDRARHQLADAHFLEEDVDGAGVGPGHLEQVGHHALEAAQVVAEELQGPLGAHGEVVAVGLEHLDRGGQGGEGRPQLVADVGVEARLALNALLQLVDHGVEGIGEALEVGVGGLEIEPGVELAPGDGAGGPGDDGQRAQRARAGEAAERDPEDGGDDAGDNEGEGEHAQRVVEVGQVEHVEVVGVDRGDRDADHDLGRALRRAVASAWPPSRRAPPRAAVGDGGGGHRLRDEIVGLGAVEEHGVGVGPRVDVAEQAHVGRGARLQRAAHRARR